MSCMEHSCIECGHMVMNNDRGPSFCPKCGGSMAHACDEVFEDRYDDEDDGKWYDEEMDDDFDEEDEDDEEDKDGKD